MSINFGLFLTAIVTSILFYVYINKTRKLEERIYDLKLENISLQREKEFWKEQLYKLGSNIKNQSLSSVKSDIPLPRGTATDKAEFIKSLNSDTDPSERSFSINFLFNDD